MIRNSQSGAGSSPMVNESKPVSLIGPACMAAAEMLSGCPTADQIFDFVNDWLDDRTSEAIGVHLDDCLACDLIAAEFERQQSPKIPWPPPKDPLNDDVTSMLALLKALEAVAESQALKRSQRQSIELAVADEIGDFRILHELGSGAFANVYLAQQKSMHRLVALKVTNHRSHEAAVLSTLDHPHIVGVFDERELEDTGLRLLYMQYIPGGNLKQVVDRIRVLTPDQRSNLTLQEVVDSNLRNRGEVINEFSGGGLTRHADWPTTVCRIGARLADALSYAHANNVLHRDIKPANVLLTANAMPMLADFNVSFGQHVDGADPNDFFGGSLPYMSPENLEVFLHDRAASDINASDDLYALGVLLWELLTGKRPFADAHISHPDRASIYGMIAERRQTLPLLSLPTSCPQGLRQVICDCLAPDRSKRLVEANHVARSLQLSAIPEVQHLLAPADKSWSKHALNHPVVALLICGLVPNVFVTYLNNRYNFNYSTLDRDIMWKHLSLVNVIVFSLGIAINLWYAWPIAKAVSIGQPIPIDSYVYQTAVLRCKSLATVVCLVIFGLWITTGIAFPIMNYYVVQTLPFRAYAEFFTIQMLHGVFATSVSYFAVATLVFHAFLPRLFAGRVNPIASTWIGKLTRQVTFHTSMLGLTPSAALIALAIFTFQDGIPALLLIDMGIFFTGSYCLALVAAPRIRRALQLLKITLTPTKHLLYGEPISRDR